VGKDLPRPTRTVVFARLQTSVGDHSSVDRQGCTDDVGCLVRGNEHDGIGNFFGSADALVRNLCIEEICFVFLCLGKVVEHSRFYRTRANDIDTNAGAGEFEGRLLALASQFSAVGSK
jgi:hypothetical protein